MKKLLWFGIIFVFAIVALAADVNSQVSTPKPVTFLWTAPGDDGTVGTAFAYDIRHSTDSVLLSAWTAATQLSGEPIPKISGSLESWATSINVIEGTKYYFAIKASDEAGNWSLISPIVSKTWLDTTPPAAIIDFRTQ